MPPAAIAIGAGALVGGIAGSMGKQSEGSYSSNVSMGPASGMENFLGGTAASSVDTLDQSKIDAYAQSEFGKGAIGQANLLSIRNNPALAKQLGLTNSSTTAAQPGFLQNNFNDLNSMVQAGPGQSDVSNSLGATRNLADMYQQYSQNGGLPNAQDISSSNDIAKQLFAPQQVAQNQAFEQQSIQANRAAGLMGRSTNDPILQAKLAQEQTRQGAMLQANQGAFAQQFALGQPDRRLGYAAQHANILGGLATQAMSNRQSLAAMGEGIMQNERNFRLATASRSGTQTMQSGGGIGGAITGALGGAGTGMAIGGLFGAGGAFGAAAGGGAGASSFSGMNYNQSPQSFFGVGNGT